MTSVVKSPSPPSPKPSSSRTSNTNSPGTYFELYGKRNVHEGVERYGSATTSSVYTQPAAKRMEVATLPAHGSIPFPEISTTAPSTYSTTLKHGIRQLSTSSTDKDNKDNKGKSKSLPLPISPRRSSLQGNHTPGPSPSTNLSSLSISTVESSFAPSIFSTTSKNVISVSGSSVNSAGSPHERPEIGERKSSKANAVPATRTIKFESDVDAGKRKTVMRRIEALDPCAEVLDSVEGPAFTGNALDKKRSHIYPATRSTQRVLPLDTPTPLEQTSTPPRTPSPSPAPLISIQLAERMDQPDHTLLHEPTSTYNLSEGEEESIKPAFKNKKHPKAKIPSVVSSRGPKSKDLSDGSDGLIASVSTDLMDSFIDEMNGKFKQKKHPRRSRQTSMASLAQFSHPSRNLADNESAGGLSRSRRARVRSDSASSNEAAQKTPSLHWQSRMMMAPETSGGPLRPHSADIGGLMSGKVAEEPSVEELKAIAAELLGLQVERRELSRPSKSELSINDIIRKHVSASPTVFGLQNTASSVGGPIVHGGSASLPQWPLSLSSTTTMRHSSPDGSMDPAIHPAHTLVEKVATVNEELLASSSDRSKRRPLATFSEVPGRTERPRSHSRLSRSNNSPIRSRPSSILSKDMARRSEEEDREQLAAYLRSHRLTRLINLRHPCVVGQQVSIADVGDPAGYPVLVFLGLGSVRYLVALFDEIAAAHRIRLICIDRWGLGRSTEVPSSSRGMREWACVVEDVMDQMGVKRFAMLAHSAGTPYALATALHMPSRVMGKIHLLSPWVSVEVAGSYKWLKYVPNSVIKTAQATEWKLQGWMLGKPPRRTTDKGIGYNARVQLNTGASSVPGTSEGRPVRLAESPGHPPDAVSSDLMGDFESNDEVVVIGRVASDLSTPTQQFGTRSMRLSIGHTSSRTSNETSGPSTATNPSRQGGGETPFVLSLLQASHAEALSGGTADLLTILGKDSKPWGFSYKDIRRPCKIWYGQRDDKIPEKSMRWLVEEMEHVELITLPNEGHNLMTSSVVMLQVLESLAQDARRARTGGWSREVEPT